MNKPTKIQRTVEFDEVLDEAELIIQTEVRPRLETIIRVIDSYRETGRRDHDYLLMVINDVRSRMFSADLNLSDANSMVVAHRDHLQAATTTDTTEVEALKSAVEGLKSSMVSATAKDSKNKTQEKSEG